MNLRDHWLQQGGDFAAGVALLLAQGRHLVTARILVQIQQAALTGQPGEYLVGKLTDALAKLPAPVASVGNSVSVSGIPSIDSSRATIHLDGPTAEPAPQGGTRLPAAGPLRDEGLRLHRRHSAAHALMARPDATDAERAELAREIMLDIMPALDALYDRIRAGKTDLPPTSPLEQENNLTRLLSLRTRVSRLRNKLIPAATGERLAQLEQELAEKLAEIDRRT